MRPRSGVGARAAQTGKHTRASFPRKRFKLASFYDNVAGWPIQFFETDAPYGQMDTNGTETEIFYLNNLETQTVAFRFTFWETGRLLCV